MQSQAIEEKSSWVKHVNAYRYGNFASKAAYCTGHSHQNDIYAYKQQLILSQCHAHRHPREGGDPEKI